MFIRFILLLLLVTVACKGPEKQQANLNSEATSLAPVPDSARGVIDSLVKRLAIQFQSRIAVKVGKPGENVMYYGYDGRTGKEIEQFDIPYEIGSNTKMFTASSIMQLVEQGKLDLEMPFNKILPADTLYHGLAYVENGVDYIDSIKVRHLLNHSSGMPDYFVGEDDVVFAKYGDRSIQFTDNDLIAISKSNPKDRFKPGTKYEYSNINYIFLGQIIEKVSGQSYTDYVQEHILDPLKLEHTYFGTTNPPELLETGHFKKGEAEMPYTMAGPAGEIISTLDDMYTFIDGYYNGALFEKEETLDHLLHSNFMDMGMGLEYGLGVIKFRNHSWGHAGQTFGFQTYSAATPSGYRFAIYIDDGGGVSAWIPAMNFSLLLDEL